MKKIGLYLDSVLQGGTFQYNLSILDAVLALPSDEYDTLIAYTSDLWDEHLKKENIQGIRIDRTYLSRLWFQIRFPLWFWRNYSQYFNSFTKSFINQNCDLWIFPSQDIWSYSLPIKALGTIHDLMHRYERDFTEAGSTKEYRFRELHYSRMCKHSKGILVDSGLGKQQLVESYMADASKIHILPFIAPRYIFENNQSGTTDYNLPSKYIFYPAQFWEHKNHKGLVKATAQIINKTPDLKMVFVGAPNNCYSEIVKLINRYSLQNVFIFLDHIPDENMRQLYLNARAMIMPTFFGPTNIPPLEAFATGCPVATSKVYAMPEQVGDAGLLFDPNSTEEIADIIFKLWTDDNLVKELHERGLAKSKSWQQKQFSSKFMEIIDKVIHK